MKNAAFLLLAFITCGFIVAALLTDAKWPFIGFALAGGLMFVLFPRRSAGDPEDDLGTYSWMLPSSQPARTIVAFLIGAAFVGVGIWLLLR